VYRHLSETSLFGPDATDTQATVSITAPAKGFVKLDGTIIAFDTFSSICGDSSVYLRLHDDTSGASSPMVLGEGGDSTRGTSIPMSISWVFPVTAGQHSYSLTTAQIDFSGGPFLFYNPVLFAQYVPFGATGTAASLGTSARRTAAHPRRLP
jgi:hypothetical protein